MCVLECLTVNSQELQNMHLRVKSMRLKWNIKTIKPVTWHKNYDEEGMIVEEMQVRIGRYLGIYRNPDDSNKNDLKTRFKGLDMCFKNNLPES